SVKELRVRIKSVGNIKQITRAMEMVSTTKLRRFQDRAVASRPYAEEIAGLVQHLAGVLGKEALDQPLFQPGAGEKTALLIVSSDRGLCGAYNSNLFNKLEAWMKQHCEERQIDESQIDFFVYGRKANRYLKKRKLNIAKFMTEPALESIDFAAAARVARVLVDAFASGEYRDVKILYTAFESMVRYTPTFADFLPVAPPSGGEEQAGGDMILEPDAKSIFEHLVPRYLETRIFNALLESLTSEYASRRFSMKNATDAATDMQKALKGQYNRLRQENITKELLDIVGGAEAVK
ncbi:MAG: ATP synthase F1 subunit gamma, partial [Planctomycetes bacterium]|nr:ATP synthase F1 subunit gamma [Planctomycetota bacterium]